MFPNQLAEYIDNLAKIIGLEQKQISTTSIKNIAKAEGVTKQDKDYFNTVIRVHNKLAKFTVFNQIY
jgi:hypothetical protein